MGLPSFSLKWRVTTMMIMAAIVIFGVVSFSKLPMDLMPNIEIPYAVVSIQYAGAGPQEVENLVTKPVEAAIGSVGRIKSITSQSSMGLTVVVAEFTYGTDMSAATADMREKIDLIKKYLPQGVGTPMVMTIDLNAQPVMQLSLSGSDDLARLQIAAEDIFKPRLERLDGVASVSISGGIVNEVLISVDGDRIRSLGLTPEYIAGILGADNLTLSSGEIKNGGKTLPIRTTGEFSSVSDFENAVIPLPRGGTVRLKDIAKIEKSVSDQTTIAKVDGVPCVNISIQKQSGANTVRVSSGIDKEIEKLESEYPEYSLYQLYDMADYINMSIKSIFDSAVWGGILAILILFIFLRDVRATLIIGLSIPVSVITTFTLLYLAKLTLNMMTLGGLALGIGMMVDNSIVVLENIYRHRQLGEQGSGAILNGAGEVSLAITASTLTTIAVFAPIVFVEGMTSAIFRELAMTVTLSLLASLLIALTVVPLLCDAILPDSMTLAAEDAARRMKRRTLSDRLGSFGNMALGKYERLLSASLRHRFVTILVTLLVFASSIATMFFVGTEYFPATDEGMIQISVSLPEGSRLEDTENIVDQVVKRLDGIPETRTIFTTAGSSMMTAYVGIDGGTGGTGEILVRLIDLEERTRSATEIGEEIKVRLHDVAGAKITVSASDSASMNAMSGDPVSLTIKGDDLDELKRIAADVALKLSAIPGVTEVKNDTKAGAPEIRIAVNRDNAARFGLNASSISSGIRSNLKGVTATRFKQEGEELDVVVKCDDAEGTQESLKNIMIPTPSGSAVPLSLIADVSSEIGPNVIDRKGQVRYVTVGAQISGRKLAEVSADVEKMTASYPLMTGYSISSEGMNETIEDSFRDLGLALILAVLLVYFVLASQFESMIMPFSIMLTVPLGFSGGFLALFAAGKPLSVPALIGIIMLAGIVCEQRDRIGGLRQHPPREGQRQDGGSSRRLAEPRKADLDDDADDGPCAFADDIFPCGGQRTLHAAGAGHGGRPDSLNPADAHFCACSIYLRRRRIRLA